MNAQDSRLTCEHCHGTGYISTAIGKPPCPACSASEIVRGGQDSPQPVAWRVSKPDCGVMYLTDNEDWACFCASHGLTVEALAVIRQ